jgi:hypothetical protein
MLALKRGIRDDSSLRSSSLMSVNALVIKDIKKEEEGEALTRPSGGP